MQPIFRAGRPQPDNREQVQQGGEEEACMAVLNNFYGDGEFGLKTSIHCLVLYTYYGTE